MDEISETSIKLHICTGIGGKQTSFGVRERERKKQTGPLSNSQKVINISEGGNQSQ